MDFNANVVRYGMEEVESLPNYLDEIVKRFGDVIGVDDQIIDPKLMQAICYGVVVGATYGDDAIVDFSQSNV